MAIDPGPASQTERPRFEWDRVTAIMAVLIGACALVVSLYTAMLQNAQVRAQTWPFLQMWESNVDRSYSIANRGVGPARIMDAKLLIDNKEVENFDQAIAQLSKSSEPVRTRQIYFSRRVLASNEEVKIIQFKTEENFNIFHKNRTRMMFQICYCSVLDECYFLNENAESEQSYMTNVRQCPVGSAGKFERSSP